MLPRHVVAALKVKYETSNGLLALSRELEDVMDDGECGEGGRGVLARLIGAPYDEFRNMTEEVKDNVKFTIPREALPSEVGSSEGP